MRSPRPGYGRAGNYVYQGSLSDGRLEPPMRGFTSHNSYMEAGDGLPSYDGVTLHWTLHGNARRPWMPTTTSSYSRKSTRIPVDPTGTATKRLVHMQITMDEGAQERRFLKAIQESREGRLYYPSIRHHPLTERQGREPTYRDLRTALTFRYEELQHAAPVREDRKPSGRPPIAATTPGATIDSQLTPRSTTKASNNACRPLQCMNRGKKAHKWHKSGKPRGKCPHCHKYGHWEKEYPQKNQSVKEDPIATLIGNINPSQTQPVSIHLDTACPVHIVNKLHYLTNISRVSPPLSFSSVTNSSLSLTTVGTTRIRTQHGVIQLEKACLAEHSPVNILSLGELHKKGWTVALQNTPVGRYISKDGKCFSTNFQNNYWTLDYMNFVNNKPALPYSQCVLATPNTQEGGTLPNRHSVPLPTVVH